MEGDEKPGGQNLALQQAALDRHLQLLGIARKSAAQVIITSNDAQVSGNIAGVAFPVPMQGNTLGL